MGNKMGNQTSIPKHPTRDLNELKAIFNPVYKVVDSTLYVRTVNYIKMFDFDYITSISNISSDYDGRYGCIVYLEQYDEGKLRQNVVTLTTYYPSFSYEERQILAQEITKDVISLFEKYKLPEITKNTI